MQSGERWQYRAIVVVAIEPGRCDLIPSQGIVQRAFANLGRVKQRWEQDVRQHAAMLGALADIR